jgi:glycyl-tRNA synthetase beta chain
MSELFVELFSEEIPARMQVKGAEDFRTALEAGLKKAGLAFTESCAYSSARRIAVVVRGLPDVQPDIQEDRKGPKVGAPPAIIEGFLRGAGLDSLDQCEQRDTGKGVFWFVVKNIKGQKADAVLPGLVTTALQSMVWPKSMRWKDFDFAWVRPLHSIIALFDGKVLNGALPLGGMDIPFGNSTEGHRFLGCGRFEVQGFDDYKTRLLTDGKVVLDRDDRKRILLDKLQPQLDAAGVQLKQDDGLMEEVLGLVEWPEPLLGRIDADFMTLPPEVLTTTMRSHQKYFAVQNADGTLAPYFVVTANITATDGGAKIIAGNQRVLRARLSDARFFYDTDRKIPLEDRLPALEAITFHAKLGTVAARVGRLKSLAHQLAEKMGADAAAAARAAMLCKADLVTGMVGEFPELQGLMGAYYAKDGGEPAAVAAAIADHYKPAGPADRCPSAPVSVAVALADKLDVLAGFWSIAEKPTGSKDPYALRRAALGIIRLILENGLRLPLRSVLQDALRLYGLQAPEAIAEDLFAFFADRLKVALKEKGLRHDLIDAVVSLGTEDDLVRLVARVTALQDFVTSPDGESLLAAYRRAGNIVRIEERKSGDAYTGKPDTALLIDAAEKALVAALQVAEPVLAKALAAEAFKSAMEGLAGLRGAVDHFFADVTVNADDPALRVNRLRLLRTIIATFDQVADFSKIEG